MSSSSPNNDTQTYNEDSQQCQQEETTVNRTQRTPAAITTSSCALEQHEINDEAEEVNAAMFVNVNEIKDSDNDDNDDDDDDDDYFSTTSLPLSQTDYNDDANDHPNNVFVKKKAVVEVIDDAANHDKNKCSITNNKTTSTTTDKSNKDTTKKEKPPALTLCATTSTEIIDEGDEEGGRNNNRTGTNEDDWSADHGIRNIESSLVQTKQPKSQEEEKKRETKVRMIKLIAVFTTFIGFILTFSLMLYWRHQAKQQQQASTFQGEGYKEHLQNQHHYGGNGKPKPPYGTNNVPPTVDDHSSFNTITYHPGKLINSTNLPGLRVSVGLHCEQIAQSEYEVSLHPHSTNNFQHFSSKVFHNYPDAAGVFDDVRDWNQGGWIYVSNSEEDAPNGGVGALTFSSEGKVIDYQWILGQTYWNCGGGKTPWNTFVSCEEHSKGQCWQVDPTGEKVAQKTQLGGLEGGNFESMAVDNRIPTRPHFFVTEDNSQGALRRYTPHAQIVKQAYEQNNPWQMLHQDNGGIMEYLVFVDDDEANENVHNDVTTVEVETNNQNQNLIDTMLEQNLQQSPQSQQQQQQRHSYLRSSSSNDWSSATRNAANYTITNSTTTNTTSSDDKPFIPTSGTYYWSTNKTLGQLTAKKYFPNTEGIDFIDNTLYFISKERKQLFQLLMDENVDNTKTTSQRRWISTSTKKGTFEGQPDQIIHTTGMDDGTDTEMLYTYYTEDGSKPNGIHGRNHFTQKSFTILEGQHTDMDGLYNSETTGLAFSPDHLHLYVAFQWWGTLLDCTRQDGLSFRGRTVDIRYHKD